MKSKPAISVVLPVYNCEKYIKESISSILAQTFEDFELIIINDGSTDASGHIIRKLKSMDQRIVLIEQANKGLIYCLNKGIEVSRADYIARMDADDVSMPNRFELQYNELRKNPQLGVLGSFTKIIDSKGRFVRLGLYPVSPSDVERLLYRGSPVPHPAVMMRRDVILSVGGYREIFIHCEDYDLWLRVSELGYKISNLPKFLLEYRIHNDNISVIHRSDQDYIRTIAILSHRARVGGYQDPVDRLEKINSDFIESLPIDFKNQFNFVFFFLRYLDLFNASRSELIQAWSDYLNHSPGDVDCDMASEFLIKLSIFSFKKKLYFICLNALFCVARINPSVLLNTIYSRIKIFMIRFVYA